MKWIKIVLRGGKEFSFPDFKVIAILEAEDQLVRIHDKDKEWTGVTINKADISYTEYDADRTRQWKRENEPKLQEVTMGRELTRKEIEEAVDGISKNMHIKP